MKGPLTKTADWDMIKRIKSVLEFSILLNHFVKGGAEHSCRGQWKYHVL